MAIKHRSELRKTTNGLINTLYKGSDIPTVYTYLGESFFNINHPRIPKNKYLISRRGRVISFATKSTRNPIDMDKPPIIKKTFVDKETGLKYTSLFIPNATDGKSMQVSFMIHNLLAYAFIRKNKICDKSVIFIDDDRTNLSLKNLRWVNRIERERYNRGKSTKWWGKLLKKF